MSFERVTLRRHCPICDKPDWCSITDGGVICMRVESQHATKNGGWFHPSDKAIKHEYIKQKTEPARAPPNFTALMSVWRASTFGRLDQLASELELEVRALDALGTAYSQSNNAYAFPMSDPDGRVVGIRLRNDIGEKWAIRGSKAGLFIPWDAMKWLSLRDIFICEGPTDTAAALTLGFFAIGRHACIGQEDMVAQVIKESCAKNVYVCFDNDGPGVRGAEKLCQSLNRRVTRVIPPAKDLREFVANGGSRELLLSMSSNTCNM